MIKSAAVIAAAACLLLAFATPATAKMIEVPVHWSIQKGELSILRLRLYAGPEAPQGSLRKKWCFLARGQHDPGHHLRRRQGQYTSFTYTKRDCQ